MQSKYEPIDIVLNSGDVYRQKPGLQHLQPEHMTGIFRHPHQNIRPSRPDLPERLCTTMQSSQKAPPVKPADCRCVVEIWGNAEHHGLRLKSQDSCRSAVCLPQPISVIEKGRPSRECRRPKHLYLNPASVAFAEDTRHQARSRMTILQALYNAVDLVKEALPKGSVFPK